MPITSDRRRGKRKTVPRTGSRRCCVECLEQRYVLSGMSFVPHEIVGAESQLRTFRAADVDNDGKPDYLVTVPGHLAVAGNSGAVLWSHEAEIVVGGQSESKGLPGLYR